MSSPSSTEPALPIRRRRVWRTRFVRAGFIFAVVMTLLVAVFWVERFRGRSAWKQYQERARARNVKLTLAEYIPAPVADERNFAAIPLFQAAFRDTMKPNPFLLPAHDQVYPPTAITGPTVDFAAWQMYFVKVKFLPAAGPSAVADVLTALDHFEPEFAKLRTAAHRPESRFPVKYEDGIAAALPHVGILLSACRLVALRLAAHLERKDSAAAGEDFALGLRLYTALEKEPTLIAGLVRQSVLAMMENAVLAGVARRQWTEPELARISARLANIRLFDDYALSVGSERAFTNLIYDQLVQNGSGELASLVMRMSAQSPALTPQAAGKVLALYPTGWLRLSQVRTNRYFDEMLARVSQEPPRIYRERLTGSLPEDLSDVGYSERVRYLMFLTLASGIGDLQRGLAYGQALHDETLTGCALERYRLANGRVPESLDALVPALLPEVPRDVMNGEPLRYRPGADGGYTLYSVGWNLRDDGGKIEPKVSASKQLDWVWSVPGSSRFD